MEAYPVLCATIVLAATCSGCGDSTGKEPDAKADLPEISTFLTKPSDRFLVDIKDAGAANLQPLVMPDEDGWMTLPVTDLVFPPWCSECGAPTLERQPFRAHHATGYALILIPVCEPCQKAIRQNYRRVFWKPFLIVLLVAAASGFAIGAIPALTGRDPQSFPILSILCSLGLDLVVFPLAWVVLRKRGSKPRRRQCRSDVTFETGRSRFASAGLNTLRMFCRF